VIRSHHERFDGKGYPDGLRGEAIPLPARIAAAADCFDHLVNGETFDDRIPFPLAKQRLERERGGCFDPAVIRVLLEVAETSETAQHVDEAEIAVVELREGMTITRDIRTSGGMLLLVAGSTIQPRHLKRILAFHHVDPIVDRVRIRRSAS
jgi:HD-GYP domain-containing protein (c-di-GMP phosphodiesterase class II)